MLRISMKTINEPDFFFKLGDKNPPPPQNQILLNYFIGLISPMGIFRKSKKYKRSILTTMGSKKGCRTIWVLKTTPNHYRVKFHIITILLLLI